MPRRLPLLYKRRYAVGGDLHIGPDFRAYAELYHGQQTGHGAGSVVPRNQRSDLALLNGFVEYETLDNEAEYFSLNLLQEFFNNIDRPPRGGPS
jgi:hypothetical protein